ncbi:MAG: hypothetical protein MUC56_13045 [Thermoanaerobaculales bacterium]|jgi:hypothetical protein|nr:hypothetical protein [Thermoanaerobaculales bacterium]
MTTVLLTVAIFLLAVLAMVGAALVTGRSLKGSCGGPSCGCAREGHDITRCENGAWRGDLPTLPNHPDR